MLSRIFVLLIVIPSSVLAIAYDGAEDSTGLFQDDQVEQQTEFQVPEQVSTQPVEVPEYTIGPLDLLEIEVFRVEDLNRTVRVNSDGMISFPLVGQLYVTDKTVNEVEQLIRQKLQENFLQDPHVTVFIKEYESQKITINGWVESPGVFPLMGKVTLIQAISMARGVKRLGDATDVVIFREQPGIGTTGYKINFEDVQAGLVADPVLQKNDIIVVPQNGSKAAFDETRKTIGTFIGFLPYL